ncbi:MAG TPA: CYTH domain-containing protein [Chitinophagaceae bacterium]|nr:CYTH domain-containing protein [Chitinophagaceae bacterium]
MAVLNFEFKARTTKLETLEALLQTLNPQFIGVDKQTDTYFNAPNGRLKLRQGNIENSLIHYNRSNVEGAKQSDVLLYHHQPEPMLLHVLTAALGIKTVVQKSRKIYFIENVKFHFDEVGNLGTFIEVEAIDKDGSIGIEKLKEQCHFYAQLFAVLPEDYIAHSYSDLLLQKMA